MEENLFLEETQKTVLQSQDLVEHDPNAALRNPDGYTPVGDAVDNTPVIEVDPNNIGEVAATTPVSTRQVSDLPPETYGGTGDFLISPEEEVAEDASEDLELIPLAETSNVRIQTLSNLDSGSDSGDDNPVDSETPNEVVEPPEASEPEDEPVTPVVPEEPTPEPPAPEEPEDPEEPEPPAPPEPEDPEEPEEPEPPTPPEPEDPEEPEPPTPEEPSGQNPGNNKDVGNSPFDGITGNSGNNGDRTPPGGPMDGGEDDIGEQPGWKGNGPSNANGNQNSSDEDDSGNGRGPGQNSQENNGWGNGDDNSPGRSGPNNNAENDEDSFGNYDDLVSKFLEQNSQEEILNLEIYNFDDDVMFDEIPQDLMTEFPEIPEYGIGYDDDFTCDDFG